MSGIFPESGVGKSNAVNTATKPLLADDCTPRYYGNSCQPIFDPAAANAVISEILNLMKCAEIPYDCDNLDNLCKAIRHHGIAGTHTFSIIDGPLPVPTSTHTFDSGDFTVPNTYHQDIQCMAVVSFDVQFNQLVDGAGEFVAMRFEMSTDPTFVANHTILDQRIDSLDTANGRAQMAFNLSREFTPNIEAGGRKYYYRLTGFASANGAWTFGQYSNQYASATFYGINCDRYDIVT